MIAPDPPEAENLRHPLTGLARGDFHPLAVAIHPLTGILRRDLYPLTLGPGALTGILGGLREALGEELPQRLRDLDPPTGYARHTLIGLHDGHHPPLTHAFGTLTGVLGRDLQSFMLGRSTLTGILPGNFLPFLLSPDTDRCGHLKVPHEKLHFV